VSSTTIVDGVGPTAGYDATKELLQLLPLPDAVFCYHDFVAVGAMQAILEAGLRIPADIALIGCGNLHFANYLRVPLSSVDQQSAAISTAIGVLAIDLVHPRRAARPKTILLEPQLIQRNSTRR
jgi:LacI family transcriptional regulator